MPDTLHLSDKFERNVCHIDVTLEDTHHGSHINKVPYEIVVTNYALRKNGQRDRRTKEQSVKVNIVRTHRFHNSEDERETVRRRMGIASSRYDFKTMIDSVVDWLEERGAFPTEPRHQPTEPSHQRLLGYVGVQPPGSDS